MSYILVDRDLCCGYGQCVLAEPALFQLGDDGLSESRVAGSLSEEQEEAANRAIDICPARALSLVTELPVD